MKTRLGLIVLILLLVTLHPGSVRAGTTFTVTRLDDPAPNGCDVGGCSLREAILDANGFIGDDTIVLPAATITLSIAGQQEDASATGDLDITSNITISGAGAGSTIIRAGMTTANGIDRVIQIVIGATVTISGVTIANGHLDNGSTLFLGGGINNSGTLTLTNSTVSGNTTVIGGGMNNNGTLTLIKSTVSGNTAANGGGGIFTSGTATLNDSVVRNNTAAVIGGGVFNNGTMTLNSSSVRGNNSNGSGGGMCNNTNATLTLNNSTIGGSTSDERNTAATDGGGLFNRGTTCLRRMGKVGCGELGRRFDSYRRNHHLQPQGVCILPYTQQLTLKADRIKRQDLDIIAVDMRFVGDEAGRISCFIRIGRQHIQRRDDLAIGTESESRLNSTWRGAPKPGSNG